MPGYGSDGPWWLDRANLPRDGQATGTYNLSPDYSPHANPSLDGWRSGAPSGRSQMWLVRVALMVNQW